MLITSYPCLARHTLIPRLGMKPMPRCGSPDLYSERNSNLSFSYSKYRMLPSLCLTSC